VRSGRPWMPEIELKASRSFEHVIGRFTRGRFYRLDPDDVLVIGLVAGGYLVPTEVGDDQVDSAGTNVVPAGSVDSNVSGRAQTQTGTAVNDGAGQTGLPADHLDRSEIHASPDGPGDGADPAGGQEAGAGR
jgi:hypothetical protein